MDIIVSNTCTVCRGGCHHKKKKKHGVNRKVVARTQATVQGLQLASMSAGYNIYLSNLLSVMSDNYSDM